MVGKSLLQRVVDCERARPLDGEDITWVQRPSGRMPVLKQSPTAGASSGSFIAWVKLAGLQTDSPASGERVYKGTLYASPGGTVAGATVTIRIPSIADDWTGPASGVWADLPMFAAVGLSETWTGATTTHTETVYWITDPFRWY